MTDFSYILELSACSKKKIIDFLEEFHTGDSLLLEEDLLSQEEKEVVRDILFKRIITPGFKIPEELSA